MAPVMAAGLISAGTSLINSSNNARMQAIENERNRQFEREMQIQQQAWTQENMRLSSQLAQDQFNYEFGKEASYNSASAERQRMEAAGYNPALMYGAGTGSGVNASMNSGVNASSGSHSGANGMRGVAPQLSVPDIMSIALQKANIDVAKANERKINAEAKNIENRTPTMYNLGDIKAELMIAQKNNEISDSELKYELKENERIAKEFNQWSIPFDKQIKENSVQESAYNLAVRIQRYEFNESNNPIILRQNELAVEQSVLDLLATEVQIQANNEGIKLTKAQIITECAKNEQFIAIAKMIKEKATTEKELRGYKKAQSIVGMVTDSVDSVAGIIKSLKPSLLSNSDSNSTPITTNSQDDWIQTCNAVFGD